VGSLKRKSCQIERLDVKRCHLLSIQIDIPYFPQVGLKKAEEIPSDWKSFWPETYYRLKGKQSRNLLYQRRPTFNVRKTAPTNQQAKISLQIHHEPFNHFWPTDTISFVIRICSEPLYVMKDIHSSEGKTLRIKVVISLIVFFFFSLTGINSDSAEF